MLKDAVGKRVTYETSCAGVMPKKKKQETQADQSARFLAEVERLIAAGELNPTEAEKTLDKLVRSSGVKEIGLNR